MRVLGVPLDYCHLYGWHNVAALARHLRQDEGSFIWRAENRELAQYGSDLSRSAMLADLIDMVASFAHLYVSAHTHSKPRQPKPYPRPWKKDTERIGKDPIPISEFDKWYYGGEHG